MPRRHAPRRRPVIVAPTKKRIWIIATSIVVLVLISAALTLMPPGAAALRSRAEAAEAAKDWPAALKAWRGLNATGAARGRDRLGEARACLALGLAAQAEAALTKAAEADPADPEPQRLLLELLRTEGRTAEALGVGWDAHQAVGPASKRLILRELTLALLLSEDVLDGLPDDRALARLDRWTAADPDDANARVAQRRRLADQPRPGDPDLTAWIAELERILARHPGSALAREALVNALAETGEFDRGRLVLDAWPEADRNARHHRLMGRWALEYDRDPARAVVMLEAALADLPHDPKARAMLARAYRMLNRPDDARREATRVAALRELLDPSTLIPRLASDLARPDDPKARADLADLCSRAGLDRLAHAWNRNHLSP